MEKQMKAMLESGEMSKQDIDVVVDTIKDLLIYRKIVSDIQEATMSCIVMENTYNKLQVDNSAEWISGWNAAMDTVFDIINGHYPNGE